MTEEVKTQTELADCVLDCKYVAWVQDVLWCKGLLRKTEGIIDIPVGLSLLIFCYYILLGVVVVNHTDAAIQPNQQY